MEIDTSRREPWVNFEYRGREVSCPVGQEQLVVDYIDSRERHTP